MTDDDAERLAELAGGMVEIDVERDRAAEILARARRGPSALRLVEPVVAGILATSYLAWAIVKIVEVIGAR
jgi:hypothetical protein